jgi:hypothetical protein
MYVTDKTTGKTYWVAEATFERITPKEETWVTLKAPAPPTPGSFPSPTQPKPKEPPYTSRYHKAIDPMVR